MGETYTPISYVPGIKWPGIPHSDDAYAFAMLQQLQQTQWWSPEQIVEKQLIQMGELFKHAYHTVPFYRDRLEPIADKLPHGLTEADIRKVEPLTRSAIQDNGKLLGSQAVPQSHAPITAISSSGSTSQPITVASTMLTKLVNTALALRYHQDHNRPLDVTVLNLTFGRTDGTEKEVYDKNWMEGYESGPAHTYDAGLPVNFLYEKFIKIKPAILQCYGFVLQELILRSVADGVNVDWLQEARVYGGAVESTLRELCAEHWGVKVTENYSATEVGLLALQCTETEALHIQSENVYVEVLGEDGEPCKPGEIGSVYATALHNFATPLIRYDLGDYAEVGESCQCGRGLPTIKRVIGRHRSMFINKDGEKFESVSRLAKLSKSLPFRQIQLIQKSVELIQVNLVVFREPTPEEYELARQHFNQYLYDGFEYDFKIVDEIPRNKRGKYEATICEVMT